MTFLIQLVISLVIAYVAARAQPGPPSPDPAVEDDVRVPTAKSGKPIPVIFGEELIENPNVVWWGDLDSKPVKTQSGK
ncbi:MAG: hypothetical protein K6L81_01990 [Agarilytica sp.]